MFAVGSVPLEDCQGQGCGCPPRTWAGGHLCLAGADITELGHGCTCGYVHVSGVGQVTLSYGIFVWWWWGVWSLVLSLTWWPCGGLIWGA